MITLLRCPACDRLYEPDANASMDPSSSFCEVDGERLVAERVLAPTMPVAPPPASLAFLEEPTATRVVELATTLRAEQIESAVGALAALAERFEASGLAWQPSPEDFALGQDGKLGLLHARGVYRSTQRLDVRGPLHALGEALAGASFARVRTSVVELLSDPRLPVLHASDLKQRLGLPSPAPRPVGRNAATFIHLGYRREKQDDAVAAVIGTRGDRPFVGMVLCDGISSSADGAFAATVATATVEEVFRTAPKDQSIAELVTHAIHRAQDEVCRRAAESMPGRAPGSTIVVAMLELPSDGARPLAVAWAGDSRAYVLGRSPRLLTRDHSWGNEMLETGGVAFEEAFAQPLALALTRFVGPPDPTDPPLEVDVIETSVEPGDMIVLCSDGLWSYAPAAAELMVLARGLELDAVGAARAFVHETLVRGAHDNVSVAVCVVG